MGATPTPGGGLLHLLSGLPCRMDPEFSAWCDRHHREVLSIPGVLRARRLVRDPDRTESPAPEGPDRYLTCYDLADPGVIDSEAFRSHGDHSTPMPEQIGRSVTFDRLVLRVTGVAGISGSCDHVARVAWNPRSGSGPTPEEALQSWWPELRDQGLAAAVTVAVASGPQPVAVALFACDSPAAHQLEKGDHSSGVPRATSYRLVFEACSGPDD